MTQDEHIEIKNPNFTQASCLDHGLWRISRDPTVSGSKSENQCVDELRCKAAGIALYHHAHLVYIPTWAGALIFDMERYWLKEQLGKCIDIVGWVFKDCDRKSKYSALVALIRGHSLRIVGVIDTFDIKLEEVRDILRQDLIDCGYTPE